MMSVGRLAYRLSHRSLYAVRTFASNHQRKPPSPWMHHPAMLNASGLRQILLPDTWRGRRAVRRTRQYRLDGLKQLTGKEPSTEDQNLDKGPLLLYIDDRPTTTSTVLSSDEPPAILFASTDRTGQELWRIANPTPWSQKSKWIKYPTYAIVGLYASLFVLWFCYRDMVPITGRWQFQCMPIQKPPLKDGKSETILTLFEGQEPVLSEEDPRLVRMRRTRAVLNRIMVASGLGHHEWTLNVVEDSDMVNATIASSGTVSVFSGLFSAAETDDEIAAILSHEVAHVLAHHAEASESGELISTLATLPALPFFAAALVMLELLIFTAPPIVIGGVIELALCRDREPEADKIGMLLMAEAGYDPGATVSFWKKVNALEQEMRMATSGKKVTAINSIHPHSAKRISQAASDVPNVLYMTGRAPRPQSLSSKETQKLEAFKRRWEEFLAQRPW